jgi:hypothetical protein
MRRRGSWIHGEWAGLIALVLALGVAVSMAAAVISTMVSNQPITSEKANLLATMTGAAIGVIGTYIGAHGRGARRADDNRRESDQNSERRARP